MFNIGIKLDADKFTTETQAVVNDLQNTLNKNGIIVPVNLNNATLKEFDQFIQSIGGSMKIVKDDFTGAINAITVSIPKANGQILTFNQGVKAVYKTFQDINGVTQEVFSHFASTGITSTVSGMNKTFETVKQLQSDIVKQTQQRLQLENQLADALVQGDSKQQASLKNKIDKNTALETMYREQLQYLQQQANLSGLQVDYFETVNNQVSQIVDGTASWNSAMIQNGQESIQLAQNLGQSKDILTEYFNSYKKAMSADSGQYQQMLVEDFQNMKPAVDAVIQSMTNLGAVVDSNGASYNGNITAVQELVDLYNKLVRQTQEYNVQVSSRESDVQQIEQAVQAYKAYRDQLDKVYKLKKENASGREIKQEEESLNQLKQAYKQLEQGILSNGEAVYKNTQYNRDKNQVTRDSIQAQKELNVTMHDNSLQDLIADTLTYTLSLQSLQQVAQSVISETIELNDSMTQIRLVTEGSAQDTKELMSQYSDIAKQLGTTTSAVAESAAEWLNFYRSL